MKFHPRFFLLFFFGLSLGCSTTFSLKVPKNALSTYIKCLNSNGGVCPIEDLKSKDEGLKPEERCKATERAKEILASASPVESPPKFIPIDTAPKFKNPFSEEPDLAKYDRALEKEDLDEKQKKLIKTQKEGIQNKRNSLEEIMELKRGDQNAVIVSRLWKMLKEPVDDALEVMNSPVRRKFDDIYNAIADPHSKVNKVGIHVKDLTDFSEALGRVTERNGWEAYKIAAKMNYSSEKNENAKKELAIADLLVEYFKAYFRNGEFVSGSIELSNLIKAFPSLENYPPNVKEEIDKALKKVQEQLVFGRIGDAGFVTRFGTRYQFPPIQLKLDPVADRVLSFSKVDYVQIGNDLIRVFLEALFDSVNALPGLPESTGVKVKGGLPAFKPKELPYECVDEKDFTQMNQEANQVESGVSSVVSKLIRGGGPWSINNEALETLIENTIGTISRKAFEKFDWCWYSCGFPEVFQSLVQVPLGEMTTIEIEVNYLPYY
jgi:hypothetical protein